MDLVNKNINILYFGIYILIFSPLSYQITNLRCTIYTIKKPAFRESRPEISYINKLDVYQIASVLTLQYRNTH
ncbi:MAG: hypothetical protein JWQ78_1887 [Sediminibacterium sp.]|nr:hypothetical protein [Sediminibacterium sp.]